MFNEMGAMMKLLANKDKLAGEATKLQQTIAQITAEGTAGGGLVHVKVTGRMEVVSCRLSEEALKLNDREMLEDLIVAATNQALSKAREQLAAETQKMATAMGIPPSMLGGLGGGIPGL